MILLKIFRIKKEAIYNWYIGRIWGSIPPFSTKKKKTKQQQPWAPKIAERNR